MVSRRPRSCQENRRLVAAQVLERQDNELGAPPSRPDCVATNATPPTPAKQHTMRVLPQAACASAKPTVSKGPAAGWIRPERPVGPVGRFELAVETVAFAGHGGDQARLFGIDLDLATQATDKDVDAAVKRGSAAPGRRIKQLVAAENASWMAKKARSNVSSPRVNAIRFPTSLIRRRRRIEDQAREADTRARLGRRGTPLGSLMGR